MIYDISDINDISKLSNETIDLLKDNYVFIKGKDHYGDDIHCYNKFSSIDDLKNICDLNNDCIAFNNLGFFKNEIGAKNEKVCTS